MSIAITPKGALPFYRRATDGQVAKVLSASESADSREVERAIGSRPDQWIADQLCIDYPDVFHPPVQAYVRDCGLRVRTKLVCSAVSIRDFPTGSFVRLREDVLIPAPAFALVDLASGMPVHFAVELADELCGAYRKDSRSASGMCERAPILTLRQLEEYAGSLSGVRGLRAMQAALPFVVEGSASPMETTLSTILCLPVRRGGFGLSRPELNPTLRIPDELAQMVGRGSLRPDLLWRQRRVVVEYDSDWAHGNARALHRDALRRNVLQRMGYTVVTVTKGQLFSWEGVQHLARLLAEALQMPAPRRTKDWSPLQFQVWRDLTNPARFGSAC